MELNLKDAEYEGRRPFETISQECRAKISYKYL